MPPKTAEPHRQLVNLAYKVSEQVDQLLLDRVVNEELKNARKELADVQKRIGKFMSQFRRIADELELGTQTWQELVALEESEDESS